MRRNSWDRHLHPSSMQAYLLKLPRPTNSVRRNSCDGRLSLPMVSASAPLTIPMLPLQKSQMRLLREMTGGSRRPQIPMVSHHGRIGASTGSRRTQFPMVSQIRVIVESPGHQLLAVSLRSKIGVIRGSRRHQLQVISHRSKPGRTSALTNPRQHNGQAYLAHPATTPSPNASPSRTVNFQPRTATQRFCLRLAYLI